MAEVRQEGPRLQGLHNFRAVVGSTAAGAQVTPGLLFRSDSWHEATPDDVAMLTGELGIATIIDLRATREAESDGVSAHLPLGVRYHHLPMDRGPGTAIEGAPSGERLAARYLEYLQLCAPSVVGAVRLLADPDTGPAVVHCRAGKDRTGTLVAVVLDALGVERRWITEDYARTTANMPRLMERMRRSPVYRENVERLPPEMYSSDAATMTRFLTLLDERGGARRWLRDHEVADDTLARLRSRLIS